MTTGRIFIPKSPPDEQELLNGFIVEITGADAHHLKNVLRMKIGELIVVCFSDGSEFGASIVALEDAVTLNLYEKLEGGAELPAEVTLFQAYPKGDKLDLIVQKCTELGISRIVPVFSERCIARPAPSAVEKRRSRLLRIAESAAKQSGRSKIPEILLPTDYSSAISEIQKASLGFVCYEGGDTLPLPKVLDKYNGEGSISFFIGPEGGLSLSEANEARNAGIVMAGLGRRILRTETAPIFVMSAISLLFC